MNEEKLINMDIIYGFTVVEDSYDDPEIKKIWSDFDKMWDDIMENMRKKQRIDDLKYYCFCFLVYFFFILNIFFIAWIFE
jgi:hypothetical protein